MTFTKVAVVGGLALLAVVCWLAVSGLGVAREGLISFFALVLLVGGGNLLSGRAGSRGRRGTTAVRDPAAIEPGGGPGDGMDVAHDDEPAR